jgi:hypothetical protein
MAYMEDLGLYRVPFPPARQDGHVTPVDRAQVPGEEFGYLLLVEQGLQGGVGHAVTIQLTE